MYPPLAKYGISSPYGPRAGGFHRGLDIPTPMNTPLPSPIDGYIAFEGAISAAAPGYSDEIICIIQGAGQFVVMGHLSRTVVNTGQRVKKGDIVAYSGNSGYSTGPHLHIELALGTKAPSLGILAYPSVDITPLLRNYSQGGSMTKPQWAESIVNMVMDVIEGDPHYKAHQPKAWQGHVNRLVNATRNHEERYFLRDILRYNKWVKNPKPEVKEIIKEIPVKVEVPVEVIKEVPVEVVREVRVPAENLSAVDLFRAALKKFLGGN